MVAHWAPGMPAVVSTSTMLVGTWLSSQKDIDWGFLPPALVDCKGKKKKNYIVVH